MVKAVKVINRKSTKEGQKNPCRPKQQLYFRLNWEWKGLKLVGISTQTSNTLATFHFDFSDQSGTMVPSLFSPPAQPIFLPTPTGPKVFRRMNFSRIEKENREPQGFCKEEKKKEEFGDIKREYWLLSAPQKEHPAARAKEPSHLLPAHQEPPSQSRVEPHMAPHHVPLLSVSSLFFSEWVPPLQGWKSLPCELSHRSAMRPSLQLRCHRHDSGHPAPVTPHTSQMIRGVFLT